jgi:hypothetical protein
MQEHWISQLAVRLRQGGPLTWMAAQQPRLFASILYPPAGKEEILEAEGLLGMKLPSDLRQVYSDVGNGGFGPGYGLWGLISGHQDDGDSIVSRYISYVHDAEGDYENWKWPRSRIVVAHWGCAILSCLDLMVEGAPVYRFDASNFVSTGDARETGETPSESLDPFFKPEAPSFAAWMSAWLNGTLDFNLPRE